jgi:hypothetical protein
VKQKLDSDTMGIIVDEPWWVKRKISLLVMILTSMPRSLVIDELNKHRMPQW